MDAFKKLLKLRDWLTVPDAARHLSILLGDEVTEAHVLRFALDGRLTLSVDFVNITPAWCGKIIPHADAKRKIIQTSDGKLQLAYTWNRRHIKHLVYDPKEFKAR